MHLIIYIPLTSLLLFTECENSSAGRLKAIIAKYINKKVDPKY